MFSSCLLKSLEHAADFDPTEAAIEAEWPCPWQVHGGATRATAVMQFKTTRDRECATARTWQTQSGTRKSPSSFRVCSGVM